MSSKRTLIGLNISVFSMMLGVGMIMALLPKRIIDITGSGATVGYLASAFALSYIILQVPIGNWSDRIGFNINGLIWVNRISGLIIMVFGTGWLWQVLLGATSY